jgi:hypothetical protein
LKRGLNKTREKEFVKGLFVNRRENAPDFVKANLSFKVETFIEYLKSKANEANYVNIDIKESKEGKLYADLNDWKPKQEDDKIEIIGEEPPF